MKKLTVPPFVTISSATKLEDSTFETKLPQRLSATRTPLIILNAIKNIKLYLSVGWQNQDLNWDFPYSNMDKYRPITSKAKEYEPFSALDGMAQNSQSLQRVTPWSAITACLLPCKKFTRLNSKGQRMNLTLQKGKTLFRSLEFLKELPIFSIEGNFVSWTFPQI